MYILLSETGDATAAAGGMNLISMVLIYAVFIAAIWFFLFRPKKKE